MVEMVVPMESLDDPMPIRFTFKATNLSDITLWIQSSLVAPGGDWAGGAESHGSLTPGQDDYFLNDNYTRDKPATGTEENETLRIEYFSDAGYSVLVKQEDETVTLTYIDFDDAGYTIDDDDGFEVDLEDWSMVIEVGGPGNNFLQRDTGKSRTGVASMRDIASTSSRNYATKDFAVGGAIGYLRVWFNCYSIGETIFRIVTDAGGGGERTLDVAMDYIPKGGAEAVNQWIVTGLKVTAGDPIEIRLYNICEASQSDLFFDDIRVIH